MSASTSPLFHDVVSDPDQRVEVTTTLHPNARAWITVSGYGCSGGMRAAAVSFEAALERLEPHERLLIGVDLAGVTGASLNGQLRLVAWMIAQQHRIERIAVVSGSTAALQIAEAVVSLLPFAKKIAFYASDTEAKAALRR